ncbi:heme-binding protein 2 [Oryzias latipes]|nr:heme-binding protein 2 [Oryzias latipes]
MVMDFRRKGTVLGIFYQSVVASTLVSSVVCWESSIAVRLKKLIRKAGGGSDGSRLFRCRWEAAFSWSAEEMELQLLVALLLLLPSCGGQSSQHCHGQPCPQYQVLEANKDFEVRQYPPNDWLSTEVEGSDLAAFLAARSRLKDFCEKSKKAGQPCPDAWPAIITVSKEGQDEEVTLSWFLPPETKLQTFDTSVSLQHRDAAILFVSSFDGFPGLSGAQDHVDILKKSVAKAGRKFKPHTFTGAGYDTYLASSHYNEVWVYAA